jgi:hypothetical protein
MARLDSGDVRYRGQKALSDSRRDAKMHVNVHSSILSNILSVLDNIM